MPRLRTGDLEDKLEGEVVESVYASKPGNLHFIFKSGATLTLTANQFGEDQPTITWRTTPRVKKEVADEN